MTGNGTMPAAGQGGHVTTIIDDRTAAGVDPVRQAISNDTLEPISFDSVHHAPESGASIRNPGRYGHHAHEQTGDRRAADLPQRGFQ